MNYKRLQRNLIHLDSVDSTNNFAAKLIKGKKVENGTLILTDCQTEGRGQRGRVWQSDAKSNFLGSFVLYPSLPADKIFFLNVIASLAVHRTVLDLGMEEVWIKWPNDILFGDKKIAGILIENQIQGSLVKSSVVGIGINLNQEKFEPELKATSARIEFGREFTITEILDELYSRLDYYYDLLMQEKFDHLMEVYEVELFGKDEINRFRDGNGEFEGIIRSVGLSGLLEIEVANQLRDYQMGEIQFIY